ncbi:MAG: FAD-dependent thymidylate synthase [Alphaproteobacteria bacterium]|nr:MAG: FAD-dependent thymidylate synthase [Alphaproteobacteria bacterium]
MSKITPTGDIEQRVQSPELDKILGQEFKILDHGFIRVVDYMGTDSSIVQAARVSYGKGTKQLSQDRGLIHYLLRHKHTTPFEMCEIKLHVKMPIFVARQWIRHRTANINEYSARYSILDNEFYIPRPEDISTQSAVNKQCRETEPLPKEQSDKIIEILSGNAAQSYEQYESLINDYDLARELARANLPINVYTQMYWKIDLHNLMHFVKLRADPHSQYEIRVYAEVMQDIIAKWVPLTYEAFMNYSVNGQNFSDEAVKALKRMLKGEKITQEDTKMSKREWDEFQEALDLV